MKSLARIIASSLPFVALAVFVAAGPAAREVRAGDPCYHGFDMLKPTVASGDTVEALPCAFSPTVAVIATGGSVTFRNGPDFMHLVTGANQAWGSRDTELAPHATMKVTFDEPGVYPYACALHRGMSGAIVVGDGGAALAAAMAPAAGLPASSGAATANAAAPPAPAAAVDPVLVVGVGAGLAGVLGAMAVIARRRRDRRAAVVAHGTPVR